MRASDFLKGFHTGVTYWHCYDQADAREWAAWNPARAANIIKWGLCTQRPLTINSDGSIGGSWTFEQYKTRLAACFELNYVPVIDTSRLTNWLRVNRSGPDITESMMENFFSNFASWLDSEFSDKFFVWNPASEFNYPPTVTSSRGRNVDPAFYNPKMEIIRNVRDSLGLQDKILLGLHANLGWWAMDTLNEHFNNFTYEIPYYEGFRQNDIIGFSHYQGFLEPSHNPDNANSETTVNYAWQRAKMLLDAIDSSKPFMWMEYCHGNPWKFELQDLWLEAVRYAYFKVSENSWCNGFNWYVGAEITPEAMTELITSANSYESEPEAPPCPSDPSLISDEIQCIGCGYEWVNGKCQLPSVEPPPEPPPEPPSPQCLISFLLPLALGSIRLISLSNLRLLRNKLGPQFATDKYHQICKGVIKCLG